MSIKLEENVDVLQFSDPFVHTADGGARKLKLNPENLNQCLQTLKDMKSVLDVTSRTITKEEAKAMIPEPGSERAEEVAREIDNAASEAVQEIFWVDEEFYDKVRRAQTLADAVIKALTVSEEVIAEWENKALKAYRLKKEEKALEASVKRQTPSTLNKTPEGVQAAVNAIEAAFNQVQAKGEVSIKDASSLINTHPSDYIPGIAIPEENNNSSKSTDQDSDNNGGFTAAQDLTDTPKANTPDNTSTSKSQEGDHVNWTIADDDPIQWHLHWPKDTNKTSGRPIMTPFVDTPDSSKSDEALFTQPSKPTSTSSSSLSDRVEDKVNGRLFSSQYQNLFSQDDENDNFYDLKPLQEDNIPKISKTQTQSDNLKISKDFDSEPKDDEPIDSQPQASTSDLRDDDKKGSSSFTIGQSLGVPISSPKDDNYNSKATDAISDFEEELGISLQEDPEIREILRSLRAQQNSLDYLNEENEKLSQQEEDAIQERTREEKQAQESRENLENVKREQSEIKDRAVREAKQRVLATLRLQAEERDEQIKEAEMEKERKERSIAGIKEEAKSYRDTTEENIRRASEIRIATGNFARAMENLNPEQVMAMVSPSTTASAGANLTYKKGK